MKFIDLFAGIGGFRLGLESAGHKCVGYCEFDKFASASYRMMYTLTDGQREYIRSLPKNKRVSELQKDEYLNGEWYSKDIKEVKFNDMPYADCWTFGSPCFVKGTLITTDNGLKPIEEIRKGDKVLTHKNRFRTVLEPMMNYKAGIYTLKVQGSPKTEVTGNHRFYVRDKRREWDNSIRKYKTIYSEPYWKEVCKFDGNELIQFPHNNNSVNIHNLTDEECYLIGRYIADGYIVNSKRSNRNSTHHKTTFCIGKGKEEKFNSMLDDYTFSISRDRNVLKYTSCSHRLLNLCSECGRGAINKKIPQYIMDLPIEKLIIFLNGYMDGDGCFTNNTYKAISISEKLIYQLGQCITKCYQNPYQIHFCNRPK